MEHPELPHAKCKLCGGVFTLDADGLDLKHGDFESLYITCDHCGHPAEYNSRRDIWYSTSP